VVGVELAVGYLFAWAVRKARRVAGRADAEVDRALDAGMDHLHDVVVSRLGPAPVLENVMLEAGSGRQEPTAETRNQLEAVLEDATTQDSAFAKALAEAVDRVAQALPASADPGTGKYNISRITVEGSAAFVIGDKGRQDNRFESK
jgi:hypothetical protein